MNINEQLSHFESRFRSEFRDFMNKDERRALFDKWIVIAEEEAVEVRPYARLMVCYRIVKKALFGSSEEVAHYMGVAIDDICYAHDIEFDPRRDRFVPILNIQGRRYESFIRALVEELSKKQVSKYLAALVDVHQQETRFSYALYSLLYAVRAYVAKGDYSYAIKFGEEVLTQYREHSADYGCFVQDTAGIVDLINVEIYSAHDNLGTASAEMRDKAEELKAKEEKRIQAAADWRAAKRSELMDLAERCRIAGDMDGYNGYMSAMGDVGR